MIIIHTVNIRPSNLLRFLEKRLLQALKVSPIVVLTGAQQTFSC